MPTQSELSVDQALMRLAYDMLYNRPDTSLQIWWSIHHSRPIFHAELHNYLWEELLLEWFINRFIEEKDFKKKCEFGILNVEDADEEWLKKEMGEFYNKFGTEKPEKLLKEIRENSGEINETF